jgi:uncharacterized membrane protein YcgQ (UPF0703/DUF1980 family)
VILVPIILFLLGLPDKPPSIIAKDSPDIALATLPEIACFGAAYEMLNATSGKAKPVDFKLLEGMASAQDRRDFWRNQVVEVIGQFSPVRGSDKQFMLVRLKISCCANDAVQLDVPMLSRESIKGINHGDWVKVTGRVEFREPRPGSFMTVLIVSKADDVKKRDPDPNPYIQ